MAMKYYAVSEHDLRTLLLDQELYLQGQDGIDIPEEETEAYVEEAILGFPEVEVVEVDEEQ